VTRSAIRRAIPSGIAASNTLATTCDRTFRRMAVRCSSSSVSTGEAGAGVGANAVSRFVANCPTR
jgi:hypothetical protein